MICIIVQQLVGLIFSGQLFAFDLLSLIITLSSDLR